MEVQVTIDKSVDDLVAELKAANIRMNQLRSQMASVGQWRSEVMALLRTHIGVAEISTRTGLHRQTIYDMLGEAPEPDPLAERTGMRNTVRRFFVQHLDMDAGPNGANYTGWFDTLEQAVAGADELYGPQSLGVRQEIADGEGPDRWFRTGGDPTWHGARSKVKPVPEDMDGLLSSGEVGRRHPEHQDVV